MELPAKAVFDTLTGLQRAESVECCLASAIQYGQASADNTWTQISQFSHCNHVSVQVLVSEVSMALFELSRVRVDSSELLRRSSGLFGA